MSILLERFSATYQIDIGKLLPTFQLNAERKCKRTSILFIGFCCQVGNVNFLSIYAGVSLPPRPCGLDTKLCRSQNTLL